MGLKTVRIRMGATVQMGPYEHLKPEIEIEAEMSQGEFLDNGIELLLKQAREDLALSFWEPAEAEVKQMNICKDNPEDRFDNAVRGSDFFRWMALLHRDAAESLLADVVDEIENPHCDDDEILLDEFGDPDDGGDDEYDEYQNIELSDEDVDHTEDSRTTFIYENEGEDIQSLQPTEGEPPSPNIGGIPF